jgi:hypothetical protein
MIARARILALLVLLLAGAGCTPKPPAQERASFEVVRDARRAIDEVARARVASATQQGRPVIWQSRLEYDVKWLDQLADELERLGASGPPRDEQADELLRIGYELRQAAEADPQLLKELQPALRDLEKTARSLREFSLPG